MIAAITGSVNQPIVIFPAISHCTSFPPFNKPIPITAPTTACELETGTRGGWKKVGLYPVQSHHIKKF